MTDGSQRLLAFIPARSGSRRVPDKNARPFAGTTLIERAVATALAARRPDGVAFSSDSDAYVELARKAGLKEDYKRPGHLAGDETTMAECVLHYLEWLEASGRDGFTHVVLLQPTSPFTTAADIDIAVDMWRKSDRPSLASVTPAAASPRFVVSVDRESGVRVREGKDGRRDFYVLDGAIFISPVSMIRDTGRFWDEESALYIKRHPCFYDIDIEEDFAAAAALLSGDSHRQP